jgi:hypothetical protein
MFNRSRFKDLVDPGRLNSWTPRTLGGGGEDMKQKQ